MLTMAASVSLCQFNATYAYTAASPSRVTTCVPSPFFLIFLLSSLGGEMIVRMAPNYFQLVITVIVKRGDSIPLDDLPGKTMTPPCLCLL